MINRRGLILGLGGMFCAPAIVRVASLDMIKGVTFDTFSFSDLGCLPPGSYIAKIVNQLVYLDEVTGRWSSRSRLLQTFEVIPHD